MRSILPNWDSYLAAADERERRRARRLPSWRTQRHRRALTILMLAVDLLLIAGATEPALTRFGQPAFACVAILALVPAYFLRVLTGKMSSAFSSLLDEREREWRNRATYFGFHAMSWLMVIAMIYLLSISGHDHAGEHGWEMITALLVTGCTTPTMLLGWTLPDDDPQDALG
jgi:hypothetical protein